MSDRRSRPVAPPTTNLFGISWDRTLHYRTTLHACMLEPACFSSAFAATMHAFRKMPSRMSSLMNIALGRVDSLEKLDHQERGSREDSSTRREDSSTRRFSGAASGSDDRRSSGSSNRQDGRALYGGALGPSPTKHMFKSGSFDSSNKCPISLPVMAHSEMSAAGPSLTVNRGAQSPASEPGLPLHKDMAVARAMVASGGAALATANSSEATSLDCNLFSAAFASIPEDAGLTAADQRPIPARPTLLHRTTTAGTAAAATSSIPISSKSLGGKGAPGEDAFPAFNSEGADPVPIKAGVPLCSKEAAAHGDFGRATPPPGPGRRLSLDADRVTMSRLQLLMDEELGNAAGADGVPAAPSPAPVIVMQQSRQLDPADVVGGPLLGAERGGEVGAPQAPSSFWHEVVCKLARHPADGR